MPITTTNAIVLTTPTGEISVPMSVVEAKVLQVLRNKAIGVYAGATAQNPQNIAAGTALFRVPEMVQAGNYTAGNRNNEPDPAVLDTIEVQLNIRRSVKYELETMDMSGFTNAEQLTGAIANGVSTAILADLDSFFLNEVITQALANLAGTPPQGKINAAYSTATSEEEINQMFFDSVDIVGDLEGTVDKKLVGVNKEEVILFTNTKAGARFIKAAGGGNAAERTFSGEIQNVNGVNLVQYPLLGKTTVIAAGDSWSKDTELDLTDLEAVAMHTESIAMPFALMSSNSTIDPNSGNPKVIFKYRFGIKAVRPTLISGIFKTGGTEPTPSGSLSNITPTNPSASGESDGLITFDATIADFEGSGTATLTPTSGTTPIALSDGANTGLSFEALPAGDYTINILDDSTSITTGTATLTDPEELQAMRQSMVSSNKIKLTNSISDMSYRQLQDLAKSSGIKFIGVSKEDLIKSLEAIY